jgi:hypothetical protein
VLQFLLGLRALRSATRGLPREGAQLLETLSDINGQFVALERSWGVSWLDFSVGL